MISLKIFFDVWFVRKMSESSDSGKGQQLLANSTSVQTNFGSGLAI